MAFLDDVIRTTQKAGKVVAETAEGVYDYTKVSYNIASLENELDAKLKEIGGFVLDTDMNGTEHEAEIASVLLEAKAIMEKISEAKKELAEIKNQKLCPNCGKANSKDASFCSECGANLSE